MSKPSTIAIIVISIVVVLILICGCGFAFYFIRNLQTSTQSTTQTTNNSDSTESTDSTNTNNPTQTYSCLFSGSDSITSIPSFDFELVVSDETNPEWGAFYKDNGTRQLSLKDFKNYSSSNNVFFQMKKSDESGFISYPMYLQACKADNSVEFSSYLESRTINPIVSDESTSQSFMTSTQLAPFEISDTPGTYRIDGLVYADSQWKLVARIDKVEFR